MTEAPQGETVLEGRDRTIHADDLGEITIVVQQCNGLVRDEQITYLKLTIGQSPESAQRIEVRLLAEPAGELRTFIESYSAGINWAIPGTGDTTQSRSKPSP
jgi:hypothetical protein